MSWIVFRRRPITAGVRPSERIRYSIKKHPATFAVLEILSALMLILGPMNARIDETKSLQVSERVCAKLIRKEDTLC